MRIEGKEGQARRSSPLAYRPMCELEPGDRIGWALAVREVEERVIKTGRNAGNPCMSVTLGDCTGALRGMIWDPPEWEVNVGTVLMIDGVYEIHPKFKAQLKIADQGARLAKPGEYDPRTLFVLPPKPLEELVEELDRLINRVDDPFLREVLVRLIGPKGTMRARFIQAPAAMRMHEAFRHGLLFHSLRVARTGKASAVASMGWDGRDDELIEIGDLMITGGLLHDLSKVEGYALEGEEITLTDTERLHGHIQNGHYRVRRMMERLVGDAGEDVPLPMIGQRLLHLIESHHGTLAHGSPVLPATREAVILHKADDLCAQMGSFDRLERELPPGSAWSALDRGLGTRAFFPLKGDASTAVIGDVPA
jgi:3'-5' exoribonuclease